jgi:hypothetical protein
MVNIPGGWVPYKARKLRKCPGKAGAAEFNFVKKGIVVDRYR